MTHLVETLVDRRDIDFLLFDWLQVERALAWPIFAEHSQDTLGATLDLAERLARDHYLPHYKASDSDEPRLVDGAVRVLPAIRAALRATADAGLIAAPFAHAHGGAQLPQSVFAACEGMLMGANIATSGYVMLTVANARLLLTYGTPAQIEAFAVPQLEGAAAGTMCLSEPQAGSSLGDITTRAVPDGESRHGPRYRLFGNKMWISGGDQDATDTIVHLVLAKVPLADGRMPAGSAGISLFVVPKFLPGAGGPGARNDISVAGLNHKMGYRGTSNCLLNFGEGRTQPEGQPGAIGFLVGEVGSGLAIMFSMMNEARIAVGLGAAMLGYRGYLLSRKYAAERLQGRAMGAGAATAPVPIMSHPDVKRMLLAQKAYAEGALALVLYCARLVDEHAHHPDAETRARSGRLLELLTPVGKTWPSEWGLAANDLAIQVHGGYGYTRDFDVEQLYRDNRLNPIHEGTTGVQAMDLVRRKIIGDRGAGFAQLQALVRDTAEQASAFADLGGCASALRAAWSQLEACKEALSGVEAKQAIINATPFLRAFGHGVVAWLWLDMALGIRKRAGGAQASDFHRGKLSACLFFHAFEVPQIAAWLAPVLGQADVAATMAPEQF